MRSIGFSSGALAKGDFARGVLLQSGLADVTAVELSALRDGELRDLVENFERLDLDGFQYVSVHAPSRLVTLTEAQVVELLLRLPEEWPVILHPDTIEDPSVWARLGRRMCLENMDMRKRTGRTADELSAMFDLFPLAGFCFDLGHAHQVDSTMTEGAEMLRRFGGRLRQLHVSDVGTFGEHRAIGYVLAQAYRRIARLVPDDVPVIVESIVPADSIDDELQAARGMFSLPAAA